MSSGPSYTNRAPGADGGAPPPYIFPQASMPTPATDTRNQQAATTLDTGGYCKPSPPMPVPQTHTTTPNVGDAPSSSYSASHSGAGSKIQSAPAPAAPPISTSSYYYQAPAPAAMYVPIATEPTVQGHGIRRSVYSELTAL